MIFIEYPSCSTCKKAKKHLLELNLKFETRHIVEHHPTKEELTEWINKSDLPIKSWFNTSGRMYKELKLKDRLITMSDSEKIDLLASHGMLVKRPLVILEDKVIVGFKRQEYDQLK